MSSNRNTEEIVKEFLFTCYQENEINEYFDFKSLMSSALSIIQSNKQIEYYSNEINKHASLILELEKESLKNNDKRGFEKIEDYKKSSEKKKSLIEKINYVNKKISEINNDIKNLEENKKFLNFFNDQEKSVSKKLLLNTLGYNNWKTKYITRNNDKTSFEGELRILNFYLKDCETKMNQILNDYKNRTELTIDENQNRIIQSKVQINNFNNLLEFEKNKIKQQSKIINAKVITKFINMPDRIIELLSEVENRDENFNYKNLIIGESKTLNNIFLVKIINDQIELKGDDCKNLEKVLSYIYNYAIKKDNNNALILKFK